jgi:hypothetical protein
MRNQFTIEKGHHIPSNSTKYRLVRLDGKPPVGPWKSSKGEAWRGYKDMLKGIKEKQRAKGEG